jgi:hypothetical protein
LLRKKKKNLKIEKIHSANLDIFVKKHIDHPLRRHSLGPHGVIHGKKSSKDFKGVSLQPLIERPKQRRTSPRRLSHRGDSVRGTRVLGSPG